MKKIINFIKYNNAFTLIISLIMFSTAGAFANEKVRDTVIGQTIVKRAGVDNTQIITADLENFDMGLKINGVKEDVQFYYVNFDYNAIDVKDSVWQTVKKEKNMNVSKNRLGNMDLGLYLAEELKQLTDQEMAYMKEVQNIEKNKGPKKQTESVEYTGLKGLVFNNETKELVGYEPVKEEEKNKTVIIDAAALTLKTVVKEENKSEKEEAEKVVQQITVVKETISKEAIMEMVKEVLAQEKRSANLPAGEAGSSAVSSSSLSAGEAGSSSSSLSSSLSSSSSSVVSGGGSQSSSEAVPSSSSSESSLSAGEAGLSAGEAGSSSTESSSSAESSSSSEAVSSSSEAASLPASEASSSSVAI